MYVLVKNSLFVRRKKIFELIILYMYCIQRFFELSGEKVIFLLIFAIKNIRRNYFYYF